MGLLNLRWTSFTLIFTFAFCVGTGILLRSETLVLPRARTYNTEIFTLQCLTICGI